MAGVQAEEALFIKLGRAGEWEKGCLADGTLRFGYRETPHELCVAGDWKAVQRFWTEQRGNVGTASNDVRQIRSFYEAGASTIFITFAAGLLYWCRPAGVVEVLEDGSRLRATVDGWHSRSANGSNLTTERLSGELLKVQMFRGTICKVSPADYLVRKLNDELSPEVATAEVAEAAIIEAIMAMMRLLTWQDFELLVDLVFSASGWRRVGAVGRTQKTVDLELLLPSTGERAFVQVKALATPAAFGDYRERQADAAEAYEKMFFVWHSGSIGRQQEAANVVAIGPERMAQMVLDAGLFNWLKDKVS